MIASIRCPVAHDAPIGVVRFRESLAFRASNRSSLITIST